MTTAVKTKCNFHYIFEPCLKWFGFVHAKSGFVCKIGYIYLIICIGFYLIKGVGSIPARGPIVDDVLLNCSWLEFRHVYDFHSN